jgi:hypothetical protein
LIISPQETALADWMAKYNKEPAGSKEDSSEIYNAPTAISSKYLTTSIVTPAEAAMKAAKSVVKAMPFFGELVNSTIEFLHLSGKVVEAALEGVSEALPAANAISGIVETLEGITEIPLFEHRLHHVKEKIIRKIHEMTEEDKLGNLAYFFTGVGSFSSKIKFIELMISHHYQADFNDDCGIHKP